MDKNQPTVLHISFWADIRNAAGSIEKVVTSFASHGKKYRHIVACCPGKNMSADEFEYEGFSVIPFSENRVKNRLMNKMFRLNAFTYGDLCKKINRLRPEILHFHNRLELVDAVFSRLDYQPKIFVHYHLHFEHPVIPTCADKLVFVSHRTADYILEKTTSPKPYCIVFNPLSKVALAYAQKMPTLPHSLDTSPVILFGGGDAIFKGGRELVQAFRQLSPAQLSSAQLVLTGPRTEDLITDPSPGISALGALSADQFFDLMQEASIVVVPSYDEAFGLVAQEAMLLGKLLIASNTGGLTEFTGEDCAIIIEPKNVASLQNGLEKALALLNDADALAKKLAKAKERMRAFAPEVIIDTLESAYDA